MTGLISIPNILTMIRLAIVPILVFVSWQGLPNLFLGLLAFTFITDVLDGFVARTLDQETELGAKLDSLADFSVYMVIPICAWLLWPEVIRAEYLFVIAVIGSILFPTLVGIFKFGHYSSYHTWLTKIAAASMAIASINLFLGGSVLGFRIAAALCVCAALEEIVITLSLSEPQSNVRSLWHVIKQIRHK